MTMMFHTSNAGKEFIKQFEGLQLKAYRPSPADNLTIGFGQENALFPGTPGEIPVTEGLEIDERTANEAFEFFLANVTEPLVRKHFNPETQGEFDALVSWVWNVRQSRLERGEYTLPTVFNKKPRDFNEIVDWWIKYRNPNTPTEKGLYRRRLAELCLMMNWPHRYAWTATLKRANGQIIEQTDPWHVLEVARHEAEKMAPKTEDQITADLNNAQLEKLGGKVGQKVATPRPPPPAKPKAAAPKEKAEPKPVVIETPNLKPDASPKPMEQSKTHKGLSKKESGQETVIIGTTVTGIGALLPNINALTNYLNQFPIKTILLTVAIVGVAIVLVGAWRWWAGRMIAFEGRQEAETTKV